MSAHRHPLRRLGPLLAAFLVAGMTALASPGANAAVISTPVYVQSVEGSVFAPAVRVTRGFVSDIIDIQRFPVEYGTLVGLNLRRLEASGDITVTGSRSPGFFFGLFDSFARLNLQRFDGGRFFNVGFANVLLQGTANTSAPETVTGPLDASGYDGTTSALFDFDDFLSTSTERIDFRVSLDITAGSASGARNISSQTVGPASMSFQLDYIFNPTQAWVDAGSPDRIPTGSPVAAAGPATAALLALPLALLVPGATRRGARAA